MKSVNDGVKDQCGRTAMTDTGGVVPTIEGDRTRRPYVELWGDLLHRIDVPQCTLPFPLGNMGCVYHVYRFHLGRKFLLSSFVRRPGLLLVVAIKPLFLVFGIQLAGLFEHPAFSVGVVGRFIGGAMNLARTIEYTVQAGRARIASFDRLFPLTGFRGTESGINCRVFGVVSIIATLCLLHCGLPLLSLVPESLEFLDVMFLRAS